MKANNSKLTSDAVSASALSRTVQKLENSHLIQVTSNRKSLWRGNDLMKVHLNVKIDRQFLQTDMYSYGLVSYVEDCKSKKCYYNRMVKDFDIDLRVKNGRGIKKQEDGHVNATFQRYQGNSDANSNLLEITNNDLYYEIDVSIPKTMLCGGDQIRVMVEAIPFFDGYSIIIYGASHVIE